MFLFFGSKEKYEIISITTGCSKLIHYRNNIKKVIKLFYWKTKQKKKKNKITAFCTFFLMNLKKKKWIKCLSFFLVPNEISYWLIFRYSIKRRPLVECETANRSVEHQNISTIYIKYKNIQFYELHRRLYSKTIPKRNTITLYIQT